MYLLSSPLGHTFLSKVNLSWPKWRQEIPYSLTVHQKFIRKMWWANNGLVEGFNLQLPDYLSLFEIYWGAGERILKVTKKSGNRGRCRKLSLWSSSFWSWTTYTSLLSSFPRAIISRWIYKRRSKGKGSNPRPWKRRQVPKFLTTGLGFGNLSTALGYNLGRSSSCQCLFSFSFEDDLITKIGRLLTAPEFYSFFLYFGAVIIFSHRARARINL